MRIISANHRAPIPLVSQLALGLALGAGLLLGSPGVAHAQGSFLRGDANFDGHIDITDPIRTLEFLFLAGEEPPPPFSQPGSDPTPGLGCGTEATLELSCQVRGSLVELAWDFEGEADSFELRRDGEPVVELAAGARGHADGLDLAGSYDYEVIAQRGGVMVAQASCSAAGVEDNVLPTLELLSPQQGAVITGRSFNLRLRHEIHRILGTSMEFRVALLSSEAFHFGDR